MPFKILLYIIVPSIIVYVFWVTYTFFYKNNPNTTQTTKDPDEPKNNSKDYFDDLV